jgi:hypothetical protein
MSKVLTSVVLLASLLYAQRASAAEWCEFHASDSIYYNTAYASSDIYAHGPISFVWEPATGLVWGGYYAEQVVYYDPVQTYFADITSGTIVGSMDPTLDPELDISISSMSFSSTGEDFSLEGGTITGTSSVANLQGYLDGPFLIEATGTVVCN